MTIAFGPYGQRTRFTNNSRVFILKKKKVNMRHAGYFIVNTKRSSPQEKSRRHSLGICLKSHEGTQNHIMIL